MSKVLLVPYDRDTLAQRISSTIARIIADHVPPDVYDADELEALVRVPDGRVNSTRRPDVRAASAAEGADPCESIHGPSRASRPTMGQPDMGLETANEDSTTGLSADDLAFLHEHYREDYALWAAVAQQQKAAEMPTDDPGGRRASAVPVHEVP